MQQTDKYKLNLIETTDPLSPAPLNENTQKTEGALDAQAARIIRLENCRIMLGTYQSIHGMKERQAIHLGERPAALLISHQVVLGGRTCLLIGDGYISSGYVGCVWLTDTGFEVNDMFNENGVYSYVAFFGDWAQKHFPKPEKT